MSLLFSYWGRASRPHYWLGIAAAIGLVVLAIMSLATAMNPTGGGGAEILVVPLLAVFAWIHSAVTIKRLRDAGKPGWLYLVFGPGLVLWLIGGFTLFEEIWPLVVLGAIALVATPGLLDSKPEAVPATPAD